jgi:hypothetical protein
MRRLIQVTLLAGLAAGCGVLTDDSYGASERYALVRVGDKHLPVALGPDGSAPFLVSDTLALTDSRIRDDDDLLVWIRRTEAENGTVNRSVSEHWYLVEDDVLTFDSCPREVLCAAATSLVYAPMMFQVVGDSLFQIIVPPFQGEPMVYGRVKPH